jgi:chromosome segregation ATPase
MVYAMDTLGYAQRLREAGIPQHEAEAHASAARDYVMAELVTKTDLQGAIQLLDAKILATKADLQNSIQGLDAKIDATKAELQNSIHGLDAKIDATKADLQGAIQRLDAKIDAADAKIDTQTLRLTVRLGGIMAAGIALLGAINKLT